MGTLNIWQVQPIRSQGRLGGRNYRNLCGQGEEETYQRVRGAKATLVSRGMGDLPIIPTLLPSHEELISQCSAGQFPLLPFA